MYYDGNERSTQSVTCSVKLLGGRSFDGDNIKRLLSINKPQGDKKLILFDIVYTKPKLDQTIC